MVINVRHTSCLCLMILSVMPQLASGQTRSDNPLFADDTPLQLRLTAPIRRLSRDDSDDRPERPGSLMLLDGNGDAQVFDVDVRIRGETRLRICSFPPLRIDFTRDQSPDQVGGTLFEGQNNLKLVTLCGRTDEQRDNLALEYQIYRMLNLLTDRSFRVRWATIEYVDSESNRRRDSFVEPAFFIEEEWEVAERTGLEVVEEFNLTPASHDSGHLALVAVFQYVIGNTDWSVIGAEECCHNSKVLRASDGRHFVLPYDFDFAGLIDADYAYPNQILPISRVTERLYWGFCVLNSELDSAVQVIEASRAVMESMLDDETISSRSRRRALEFLSESYDRIGDAERVQSALVRTCR